MSDLELYFAFIVTAGLFIIIPGPNIALIVANSLTYGTKYGLMTVLGTTIAMMLQVSLTVCGMTVLISAFSALFYWIKWLGVAYLLFLGIDKIMAKPDTFTSDKAQKKSMCRIFSEGFLVSLTNPKTLLFYGAFFPQFTRPHADIFPQLVVLGATFVLIALVLDACWATMAGKTRNLLIRFNDMQNKIIGGLLITAGLALAYARKN